MAILPCRLDDETGGTTHDAAGARHSGDSTVCGALIASTFSYLRDRTIRYTQASVDYADTIRARVAPLVWGGTPAASGAGTVDRTSDTYHIFSLPAQGGTGTLYICGQAQWQAIGDTYDVLGLEVLRQYEWTRYQWRPPQGCPFWTKSASDHTVRWIAGSGSGVWSGDGGDPRAAGLAAPVSVAPGPDGKSWYIGTTGAVRKATCHSISTVVGTGVSGHTGDGSATTNQVGIINGLSFAADGTLRLVDTQLVGGVGMAASIQVAANGSTFRSFDVVPGSLFGPPTLPYAWTTPYQTLRDADLTLNALTSAPSLGFAPPGFSPTDGGLGGSWIANQGQGIVIAPDGTIYLSLVINWGQAFPDTDIFGNPITNWAGIAFSTIMRVDPVTLTGTLLVWQARYLHTGRADVTVSQIGNSILQPRGLALDSLGNLYWADLQQQVIWKRTPAGIYSTVFGVLNTFGFDLTHLQSPTAVAFDGADNMFISDTGNARVLRVDAITHVATVILGITRSPGSTHPGSAGTATQISGPRGLFVSPAGIVTVCDSFNNRVLQLGGD